MKLCSICEKRIFRGYFCLSCFRTYKQEIFDNVPWIKVLIKLERKRRKTRELDVVYLGDTYDIDTDNNLTYKDKNRYG